MMLVVIYSFPDFVLSTTLHYYRTQSFLMAVLTVLLVPTAKFKSKLFFWGVILRRNQWVFLAKNYKRKIAQSFLSVMYVYLSHTKQSALYCCNSTKGLKCCLFKAIGMTHRLEPIRVSPSWRTCQGDWGHSHRGSLTHRTAGKKHLVIWVCVLNSGRKWVPASQLNYGKYWLWLLWQVSNHQWILFNKTSERQNPRGWLTALP